MSRICVKNLPKYMAEDRLRDFFSQKGEITDAKLMRTKDGKSRQFAFIGFRTEQEADEAVKYFNKSYLDTCRITCEIAHKVGDPNMPRPWSRYSLKKEKEVTEVEKNPVGANRGVKKSIEMGSENDDPKLKDFLQVMQPRVKSKMWANDTVIGSTADQKAQITDNKTQAIRENREKPLALSADSDKTKLISDIQATEKPQNDAGDEVISDMDYFKSRVKTDWSDSEGEDDADEAGEEDNDHSGDTLEEERQGILEDSTHSRVGEEYDDGETVDPGSPPSCSKVEHEEILESGRLFVRNLPYMTTEDDILEHFSRFGNVTEVHIVVDKETKRSKGIAYVLYTIPESASRAIEEVDNSIFQGRLLHVMPARQKKSSDRQEAQGQVSKTLKQRREEERKASEASGNTKAWNSLFMRPDTVVENIARKHGVRKSELLDREANDLAVRIALGETQVIAEMKKALTNAGVNVTLLEEFAAGKCDGEKRSNHIFLVKNLPYDSMEGELAKMFGKFGNLDKVVLPSTKTLAIVVFLEPAEAAAAFKGLAYKRYKGVPLYLEWAPNDLLSQNSTSKDNGKNDTSVGELDARALVEQQLQGMADDDIDSDRVESRSLFVKNLNFKTSDENLRNHFSEHMKEGRIISVKVKKHLKNGKNVSMGFGFIEFDSVDTATNICRDLQGTILDGHALVLQLCHTKKNDQVMKKAEKDKSLTKLLVRNVAFEATEKDLRQLFSPFGQIKCLRLPMKFGNHRGFAFVEYVTKQEAQNALEALSSTHLYGRHLVLERAKEGESLEELRARTTAQFSDELSGFQNQAKLSKKRKHMAILDEGKMKFERIAEYR